MPLRLRPVERRSLAAGVYAELSRQILHGGYAPGAALPPERELCALLGVKRGTLREGIKRLEQAGLLSVRQGGGTFVRDFRRGAGLEVLGELLVRPDGSFDPEVVAAVMEMRSALAPDVARQAARRRSDAHLSRLSALLEAMQDAAGDRSRVASLVGDFWDELVEASCNIAYRLAYNALRATGHTRRDVLQHVLASELESAADYASLLQAVRERDCESAGRIARELTRRGEEALVRALESDPDDPPRAGAET